METGSGAQKNDLGWKYSYDSVAMTLLASPMIILCTLL